MPAHHYETLLVDVDRKVATVTFNRPEAKNTFNRQMGFDLGHAFLTLEADDDIRAIVVTGAGSAFCGGAAIGSGGSSIGGGDGEPIDGAPPVSELELWTFSTPIIAAINGAAVGLGLTYPMQWDIRVAANDAKLGFVFNRRGLAPEAHSYWLLPRLVGLSKALDLLLTGRMFSGADAATMGLVTKAVPTAEVLPAALEIAHDIADNTAPVSVAITKKLLYAYQENPDRGTCRVEELELFHWVLQQADAREGMTSFLEKRPPEWKLSKTKDLPERFRSIG